MEELKLIMRKLNKDAWNLSQVTLIVLKQLNLSNALFVTEALILGA